MAKFEENGLIGAKLSDLCRACMVQSENMVRIYPKSEQYGDLIAMLSSVGSCEIELEEHLPNFICAICVDKLRSCYDFMQLIQRSNEMIREYFDRSQTQTEIILLPGAEPSLLKAPHKKRKMRLTQFPSEEVRQTIAEVETVTKSNLQCIKCGFSGSCMRALSMHVKHLHKQIKDTWCMICNLEVENLDEHMNSHNDRLKCKFCAKTFSCKFHLLEHLRSHSVVKNLTCVPCKKSFICGDEFKKHQLIHNNKTSFKCEKCSRKFLLQSSLEKHEKKHAIQCLTCSSWFESSIELEKHICAEKNAIEIKAAKSAVPAATSKERVLCTLCGKLIRDNTALRVHMRVHTGEQPYKCNYCDRKLATRNYLKIHERTHTGEKPYMCSYCGKGFNQSGVLSTHMKLHTGRSDICDICGKSFCRPAQLRIHMRTHTGEKPYLCTICGQGFHQKSHLSDHLRIHSDERPFKCRFCGRAFKQKVSMKSHENIHLGNKPFKCKECPYASAKGYGLKLHMKMHRKERKS